MILHERQIDWLWLIACGVASSIACICSAQSVGVTFDEPTYLEHGMNFWHTGSHHPLMKLGTMPLPVDVQTFPIAIVEWVRGERFDLGRNFARIIVWMRHGNLVFWWLLLYFAMQAGRDLGGAWAGRIAVAALSCEPNLLAHAALATTDIAITAAMMGFLVAYRRGRSGEWRQRIGWPGVWCGIALLSKASALAFCPLLLVAVEVTRRLTGDCILSYRQHLRSIIRDGLSIAGLGFAIAFIGCGSDFQPSPWFVNWADSLPEGVARTCLSWFAENLRIFGNAGEAIANQVHHNMRGHGQFLLGQGDVQPFWYYFPVLLTIKLTVPVLATLVYFVVIRPRAILNNAALIAFLVLLAFSLNCRVQLGIRLQFPAVAMLIVGLAVAIVVAWPVMGWRKHIVAAGLGAMALTTASDFPNSLCYTNRLWGGTARADRLVGDSNYDWGQCLKELDAWHEQHARPGLDVWYYGQDPMLKTLPVRDLPLHCVPISSFADMPQYIWGRKLAVSTSVIHCWQLTPAHRVALDFLARRQPVDRTRTFLIYDFSDIPQPPPTVATGPSE